MRKSKEAARWDAWYEKQETTAAPQEIPQELTRLPSPPQTMLDVGCGTGEMVRFWAGRQVHATGLDISKNAIRRAVELTSPLLFPSVSGRRKTGKRHLSQTAAGTTPLIWYTARWAPT